MPMPVSVLVASNAQLAAYLGDLERRVVQLERRTTGLGATVTVGGFVIRAEGDALIAQRITDGATVTIADFA